MGIFNEVREDVRAHMVDADGGNAAADGHSPGKGGAYQQTAHQSGALGVGDGVQIGMANTRFPQGLVDHWDDVLLMCPGGQFRNHSAVFLVYFLVRDNVRQDLTTFEHRSRGIVTRRFYGADQ